MTPEQNTKANDAQTESIVKKILTSEVKYILGIIIFLAGVVAPYYQIRQDIALIKQNHYAHIEAMTKQIEENSAEISESKITQVQLMTVIAANQVKLDLLLNK